MTEDRIELSKMLDLLRSEINQAWLEGQSSAIAFEVGQIEIELSTEIEIVQIDGKISAKFWVLGMEAKASRTRTVTQKINISVKPIKRSDPNHPIWVSGQQILGEQPPELTSPDA